MGKAVPISRDKEYGRRPGRFTSSSAPWLPGDARHIEDLKRKSFYLMTDVDVKLALGPALVTESARVFSTAAQLNHFICDALELPF